MGPLWVLQKHLPVGTGCFYCSGSCFFAKSNLLRNIAQGQYLVFAWHLMFEHSTQLDFTIAISVGSEVLTSHDKIESQRLWVLPKSKHFSSKRIGTRTHVFDSSAQWYSIMSQLSPKSLVPKWKCGESNRGQIKGEGWNLRDPNDL